MQNINGHIGTDERDEIPSEQKATRQIERLLDVELPPLYRRAYRILGNAADAEDAVQDALLAAYTHINQFRGQAQLSTWLTTILLNCARMQLRRRPRHIHLSLDESIEESQSFVSRERLVDRRPNPEDECARSELRACLTHLRRRLSPTLSKTFQLRDVEGLSIRETARILKVPPGTVKARSARARKQIEQLMRRSLRARSHGLPIRLSSLNSAVHAGVLG